MIGSRSFAFRLLFVFSSFRSRTPFFYLGHGNYFNLQRTFVTSCNRQLHTARTYTLFLFLFFFLKIERSHKTIMDDATHTHHTHKNTLLFRTTFFPFSHHSSLLTIHFECVFPRPAGLLHSFSSIPISPLPADAFRHFLPVSGTGSCGTCIIARVTTREGTTFNNSHFWQASRHNLSQTFASQAGFLRAWLKRHQRFSRTIGKQDSNFTMSIYTTQRVHKWALHKHFILRFGSLC